MSMDAIRQSIAATLIDLNHWGEALPEPACVDPIWKRLGSLIDADPLLAGVEVDVQLGLLRDLIEWQRKSVGVGRVSGMAWRAAETHLMYQQLLKPALACCRQLEIAYIRGEDGESVDWDDVSQAREFSVETMKELGLKGFHVEMDDGDVLIALASSEDQARSAAASASEDAEPVSVTLAEGYGSEDSGSGPRP